jgi:hypothetical protein
MDYLSQLTDETLENRKIIFLLLRLLLKKSKKSSMFGQKAKAYHSCFERKIVHY